MTQDVYIIGPRVEPPVNIKPLLSCETIISATPVLGGFWTVLGRPRVNIKMVSIRKSTVEPIHSDLLTEFESRYTTLKLKRVVSSSDRVLLLTECGILFVCKASEQGASESESPLTLSGYNCYEFTSSTVSDILGDERVLFILTKNTEIYAWSNGLLGCDSMGSGIQNRDGKQKLKVESTKCIPLISEEGCVDSARDNPNLVQAVTLQDSDQQELNDSKRRDPRSHISCNARISHFFQSTPSLELFPRFNEMLSKLRIVSVSCGSSHCIALTCNSKCVSWGRNYSGQLGRSRGSSFLPLPVEGIDEVIIVAAGYEHSAVITKQGVLYTWGLNSHGQLGVNGLRSPKKKDIHQVVTLTRKVSNDSGKPNESDTHMAHEVTSSSYPILVLEVYGCKKLACGPLCTIVYGTRKSDKLYWGRGDMSLADDHTRKESCGVIDSHVISKTDMEFVDRQFPVLLVAGKWLEEDQYTNTNDISETLFKEISVPCTSNINYFVFSAGSLLLTCFPELISISPVCLPAIGGIPVSVKVRGCATANSVTLKFAISTDNQIEEEDCYTLYNAQTKGQSGKTGDTGWIIEALRTVDRDNLMNKKPYQHADEVEYSVLMPGTHSHYPVCKRREFSVSFSLNDGTVFSASRYIRSRLKINVFSVPEKQICIVPPIFHQSGDVLCTVFLEGGLPSDIGISASLVSVRFFFSQSPSDLASDVEKEEKNASVSCHNSFTLDIAGTVTKNGICFRSPHIERWIAETYVISLTSSLNQGSSFIGPPLPISVYSVRIDHIKPAFMFTGSIDSGDVDYEDQHEEMKINQIENERAFCTQSRDLRDNGSSLHSIDSNITCSVILGEPSLDENTLSAYKPEVSILVCESTDNDNVRGREDRVGGCELAFSGDGSVNVQFQLYSMRNAVNRIRSSCKEDAGVIEKEMVVLEDQEHHEITLYDDIEYCIYVEIDGHISGDSVAFRVLYSPPSYTVGCSLLVSTQITDIKGQKEDDNAIEDIKGILSYVKTDRNIFKQLHVNDAINLGDTIGIKVDSLPLALNTSHSLIRIVIRGPLGTGRDIDTRHDLPLVEDTHSPQRLDDSENVERCDSQVGGTEQGENEDLHHSSIKHFRSRNCVPILLCRELICQAEVPEQLGNDSISQIFSAKIEENISEVLLCALKKEENGSYLYSKHHSPTTEIKYNEEFFGEEKVHVASSCIEESQEFFCEFYFALNGVEVDSSYSCYIIAK